MNEIDAVETILKGDKYTRCVRCDGEGLEIDGAAYRPCIPCDGSGFVVALDYLEACNVLGKEPPTPMGTIKVPKNGGVLHLPPMVVVGRTMAPSGSNIQVGDLVAFDSNGIVTKGAGPHIGMCVNPPTPDGRVSVLLNGRNHDER